MLTVCREFPRAFNKSKHKDGEGLALRVHLAHLLQLPQPQPQPPPTPQHHQRAATLVTNPSTFSKQLPKLAVAVV